MNKTLARLLAAAAACAVVSPAYALTVGFELRIAAFPETAIPPAGGDAPSFRLTNLSDAGIQLTGFSYTIGDTSRRFDRIFAISQPAGGTATLTTGDTVDNLVGTDLFAFSFTGFDPLEQSTWRAELDRDGVSSTENFRTVFFDNGGAAVPNSIATAFFTDGRSIEIGIEGTRGQVAYTYRAFEIEEPPTGVVPVPASLPMLLAGAAVFALIRRKQIA